MLSNIALKNFVIVEQLELELNTGMTALTGETGAGKSIIIDALDLILGGRANSNVIRQGSERADISAIFDLTQLRFAIDWLEQNDFDCDKQQILLRRIIHQQGRSRHFINGQACTQQQIRQLGEFLLNIHGQHEHQNLLKKHKQLELLDNYAKHETLLTSLKNDYQQSLKIKQQLANLQCNTGEKNARLNLLQYQVKELQELALVENEFTELEQQYKQFAHAEQLRGAVNNALNAIDESTEQTASNLINLANRELQSIITLAPPLQTVINMLETANIQLQEANTTLRDYLQQIDIDPEQLFTTEQRLQQIHATARKHQCEPEHLLTLQQNIQQELAQLENADQTKMELQTQLNNIEKKYREQAEKLSKSRQQAAKKLNKLVTDCMQTLGMQGGQFKINITLHNELSATGLESLEFYVTANPGQPLQPLNKIASGGEMSRISLALQMIAAKKDNTPTLIFDEVDVGIGGSTAEIVGKLLRQLGEKAQVLCITHLPQVAAQANQHLQVQKQTQNQQTYAKILPLLEQPRIQEIARMLGGTKITEKTLKHAEEMLASK